MEAPAPLWKTSVAAQLSRGPAQLPRSPPPRPLGPNDGCWAITRIKKAHRASMSLCDERLFFFSCSCNTDRSSDVIIIYLGRLAQDMMGFTALKAAHTPARAVSPSIRTSPLPRPFGRNDFPEASARHHRNAD